MSLIATLFGAIVGVLGYAGIYHAIASCARRDYGKHLVLSLVCLIFALFIGSRIYELHITQLDGFVLVHKWGAACGIVTMPLLLWFVMRRAKWGMKLGFWLLSAPAVLFLIANFALPYGLQYQSLNGLTVTQLPWGETLTTIQGEVGFWLYPLALWLILIIGAMSVLSLAHWWKTRRPLDALVAVSFCTYSLLNLQGMLARLELIDALPIGVIGVPLVIAAISVLYIYQDRRDRIDYARHLEWLTSHDEKTGLPNRSQLLRQLEDRPPLMLAMIGLDNLGRINEALGHDNGDLVIKTIAQRLAAFLHPEEIGARFEGDHFVFASPQPERVMELHKLIQESIDLGQGLVVDISAGMGYLQTDLIQVPLTALQQAQSALIQAKVRGRGQVTRFDESCLERSRRRQQLAGRMSQALAQGEFHLVYQPRVALKAERASGFEALVRWNSPDGLISPGEFIPIAEESGFIVPLGDWILAQAIQQLRTWQEAGLSPGRVAVNISMLQLAKPDFVARVLEQVRASGLNPKQLELEITESAAMEDLEFILASLKALAAEGITLAMDDFGTGYSSLSYLQKLPFHIIKIDMSFVRRLGTPEGDELVHGMMTLIRNLKRAMVAEGIETEAQLNWLRAEGCDEGQGYYLSKPLSVEDASAWLTRHTE